MFVDILHILTIVVAILVTLFQFWWSSAYLYAYSQVRESILLFQVVQGVSIGMLFLTISVAMLTGQSMNRLISGVLLLLGLVMGIMWRKRGGIDKLFEYYPRAIIDVLLFRKPKVDYKRRVRGR